MGRAVEEGGGATGTGRAPPLSGDEAVRDGIAADEEVKNWSG